MNKILVCILVVLAFTQIPSAKAETSAKEKVDSGPAKYWGEKLSKIDTSPANEARIGELGAVARAVGHFEQFDNRYDVEEYTKLLHEVQSLILPIPGHAKYYEKLIHDKYAVYEQAPALERKAHPLNDYEYNQGLAFETLGSLPSPETIEVLGNFLFEERAELTYQESDGESARPRDFTERASPSPPNAVSALRRLVENPPDPSEYPTPAAIEAWRHWYQQVKEGRRTYRFKGDPREYNLQGPVREARNPDIARVIKRPGVPGASAAGQAGLSAGLRMPWIVGILVMLAGIGALVYRRGKRRGRAFRS